MLLRHSRPLPQPFGLRLGQSLRRLLKGLDATEIGPTRHVEPAFPELRLQIGPGLRRLVQLTGGGDQLRRYVAGLGDATEPGAVGNATTKPSACSANGGSAATNACSAGLNCRSARRKVP